MRSSLPKVFNNTQEFMKKKPSERLKEIYMTQKADYSDKAIHNTILQAVGQYLDEEWEKKQHPTVELL